MGSIIFDFGRESGCELTRAATFDAHDSPAEEEEEVVWVRASERERVKRGRERIGKRGRERGRKGEGDEIIKKDQASERERGGGGGGGSG